MSRFHRAAFARLVPWIVQPADDLARGCDVIAVEERTVAVMPRGVVGKKNAKRSRPHSRTPSVSTAAKARTPSHFTSKR